jgi:predicted GNAT family acetyltransferase
MANAVRDNPSRNRYELDVAGSLAFIDYQRAGHVVTLEHAEVPQDLRGGGVGSALVRGALELARAQGDRIVPRCPFVAAYLRRHPEFDDLRADRRP